MAQLDLDWARETARMLRRRGIHDSGSATSTSIQMLFDALLSEPTPLSWRDVVARWKPGASAESLSPPTVRQHVHRIRELLTRASAFINVDQIHSSAAFRWRIRIYNLLTNAHMLLDVGAIHEGRSAFVAALDQSERYEQPDLAVLAGSVLRRLDAGTATRQTLKAHDQRIARLQHLSHVEQDVFRCQDQARLLLREYARRPTPTLRELDAVIEELRALRRADLSVATLAYHRVVLWRATLLQDSATLTRVGRTAASYLRSKPHLMSTALMVEFEGARMSAALTQKDFEVAHEVWSALQTTITAGGSNWHTLLQLYFLTCSISRRYVEARDALWLYQSQRRKSGPEWRMHRWNLYRAYLLFLVDHGVIPAGPFSESPRPYPAVLERQLLSLDHDKVIGGAAVLIYRVLVMLRSSRYGDVVALSDRLRQHASRYLRNPSTTRTGVFIRMLAVLPSAEFDPVEAQRRGDEVRRRHRGAWDIQRDDAEIIPYEDLWSIVLELLDG